MTPEERKLKRELNKCREHARSYLQQIGKDCAEVAAVEMISVAERRTWLGIARRALRYAEEFSETT